MTRVSNRGNMPETVPVSKLGLYEAMEEYNNLPPEYRKILQDAPINLNLNIRKVTTVGRIHAMIDSFQREATLAAYGPDHPSLTA